MGHVLKDLLTITEDGVAYIVLDSDTQKKYDIREGETEGFVNIPLSISNVRMSFLLKEDGEKVMEADMRMPQEENFSSRKI